MASLDLECAATSTEATSQIAAGAPEASLAWGTLPTRLRVLWLTAPEHAGWLAAALAVDRAVEVAIEEVASIAAAMARLRDEAFDAVLVHHEPGIVDAPELLAALRGGGVEEPLVVLGAESEYDFASICHEAGADAYVCTHGTSTRVLLWLVARAVERQRLIRENRRLAQAERQRLRLEQREAQRLLDQQRRSIETLGAPDGAPPALPRALVDHYCELLRAYVIMGSGNLAAELADLAELLVASGVSATCAVELHLGALEELIRGLGSRSARHVMSRADLLVLELIVHLGEGYRRQLTDRRHPPRQMPLPGFDYDYTSLGHE